ncbi:MAG: PKD domain-containing protein, partial [Thermoplasmata archaeon]|nr:PKD domain-containing protein [Thermoplasmata archaeon]
ASSPNYDPQAAACAPASPCLLPMFPSQMFDASEMALWAHEINVTTSGAIQPYVYSTSFLNIIISALFSAPGTGDTPVYGLGWLQDYADPSDFVTPMYLQDSTYTAASAVAEQLSLYSAAYCPFSLVAYASGATPVNNSCQGAAYAALNAAGVQAANLPLGPNRTLLYNQIEQVANQLALYTYTRTTNAVDVAAPWIDASRVVPQPSVGGTSYQLWTEFAYLNNSTTPNPLAAYGPIITPSPVNVTAGTTVNFAAAAGGGHGGYTFGWNGLPPECAGIFLANFSCVPQTGGRYSITVTVQDAAGALVTSDRVQMLVYVPPRALVAADSASVTSGSAPLTVHFASAVAGGTAPYVLNWSFGDSAYASVANPTHIFTTLGNYAVRLNVTDAVGRHLAASPLLVVHVRVPLVGSAVSASATAIDQGQSVNFSLTFSGNSGPVTVSWSTLPPGCAPLNVTVLACTPTAPGVYVIGANLTDIAGGFASAAPVVLTVESPLVVALPHASLAGSEVNQTVSFSVSASGGSAPFGAYTWNGFPGGACTSVTSATPSCTFTVAGTLTITAQVTDAIGVTSRPSSPLSFVVHPGLQVAAVAISNGTVAGGTTSVPALSTITFSTAITGGLGPFTIRWSGLPNECPQGVGAQVVCLVTTVGTYTVGVTVRDAAGVSTTRSTTLVVTSPGGAPSGGAGSSLLPIVLIVVVLAAAAVVVAALLRRRAGRTPANAPEDTDSSPPAEEGADSGVDTGATPPSEAESPPGTEVP